MARTEGGGVAKGSTRRIPSINVDVQYECHDYLTVHFVDSNEELIYENSYEPSTKNKE